GLHEASLAAERDDGFRLPACAGCQTVRAEQLVSSVASLLQSAGAGRQRRAVVATLESLGPPPAGAMAGVAGAQCRRLGRLYVTRLEPPAPGGVVRAQACQAARGAARCPPRG